MGMVTITCLDNDLAGWKRIFESLCLLLYFVVHSALRLFVLSIAAMSNDSSALQIPTPGLEDSYSGDEEARQRSTTTEQEERSPQVEKKQLTPRQRNDSGSSLDGERQFHITDDLKEKILTQAEYYFSDENLKRDGFLLKHIKRNKEGFVNLKLLASFKKMRSLSRDYRVIAEVLKE